jgi:hypothetical protein
VEFLPWVFVIVGVGSIVSGVRGLFGAAAFRSRAQRASAEVTERRWQGTGRGSRLVPVVRFTLADGRVVETEVATSANPLSNWEGQSVTVLYDPDDPTYVELPGLAGFGGLTSIFIGVVFLVVGVPWVLL